MVFFWLSALTLPLVKTQVSVKSMAYWHLILTYSYKHVDHCWCWCRWRIKKIQSCLGEFRLKGVKNFIKPWHKPTFHTPQRRNLWKLYSMRPCRCSIGLKTAAKRPTAMRFRFGFFVMKPRKPCMEVHFKHLWATCRAPF